jgi:hypothetical protein
MSITRRHRAALDLRALAARRSSAADPEGSDTRAMR